MPEEQRNSSELQATGEQWRNGCGLLFAGAVLGPVILIVLSTLADFILRPAVRPDGQFGMLIIFFHIPVGAALGATTSAASGARRGNYRKTAGTMCIIVGIVAAILTCGEMPAMYEAYPKGPKIGFVLSWMGPLMVWSALTILWGIRLICFSRP